MSLSKLVGVALWGPAQKLRSTDAKLIRGAFFNRKVKMDNLLMECFSYNGKPAVVSGRNLDVPAHIVGCGFIVRWLAIRADCLVIVRKGRISS